MGVSALFLDLERLPIPLIRRQLDAHGGDITEILEPANCLFRGWKGRQVNFLARIAILQPFALSFAHERDPIFVRFREHLSVLLV